MRRVWFVAQLQGRGGVEQSSHHGSPIKDVLGPEVDKCVCATKRAAVCNCKRCWCVISTLHFLMLGLIYE